MQRFTIFITTALILGPPVARAQDPPIPSPQSPAMVPRFAPAAEPITTGPITHTAVTTTTTGWTSTARPPTVINWGAGPVSLACAKWLATRHTWTINHAKAWPYPFPTVAQPQPMYRTTAQTQTQTTYTTTAVAPQTQTTVTTYAAPQTYVVGANAFPAPPPAYREEAPPAPLAPRVVPSAQSQTAPPAPPAPLAVPVRVAKDPAVTP